MSQAGPVEVTGQLGHKPSSKGGPPRETAPPRGCVQPTGLPSVPRLSCCVSDLAGRALAAETRVRR